MNLREWIRDHPFTAVKRILAAGEVRRYLARHPAPRLNIGCGGNRPQGWLNVDRFPPPGVTYLDATARLPFPDGTFQAILCEHMIEHVPKAAAVRLLGEMRRVLAHGGTVRVVTPDLNWFARRILDPVPDCAPDRAYLAFLDDWRGGETSWCDAINLCFYEHRHCYIWSIEELAGQMRRAGFTDLVVTRAGETERAEFQDVEGHPRLIGGLINGLEAFAIEARPGRGGEVPAAAIPAQRELCHD